MLIDLHIHSSFSFDSKEGIENYCASATAVRVPVIGFSEHYDYDAVVDGATDVTVADLAAYTRRVRELKALIKSPEILCGVEFGYRDFAVPHYRELVEKYDFDYAINSLHTLAGRGDCFHDEFFKSGIEQSYKEYLYGVLESVNAQYDFQIIGHLGYVARYRKNVPIKYSDFSDIIDEILTAAIKRDKCLEINCSVGTSGNLFLPDTDIIERYLQLGGKLLSYGSDAHSVDKYMQRSSNLTEYLNSKGIKELFYYKKRSPVGYKI